MKLLLLNYFTILTSHHVEVVSLLPIPLAERPQSLESGRLFVLWGSFLNSFTFAKITSLGPDLCVNMRKETIFSPWLGPKCPGRDSILFLTPCKELFQIWGVLQKWTIPKRHLPVLYNPPIFKVKFCQERCSQMQRLNFSKYLPFVGIHLTTNRLCI